jgi:hypothetical protein
MISKGNAQREVVTAWRYLLESNIVLLVLVKLGYKVPICRLQTTGGAQPALQGVHFGTIFCVLMRPLLFLWCNLEGLDGAGRFFCLLKFLEMWCLRIRGIQKKQEVVA